MWWAWLVAFKRLKLRGRACRAQHPCLFAATMFFGLAALHLLKKSRASLSEPYAVSRSAPVMGAGFRVKGSAVSRSASGMLCRPTEAQAQAWHAIAPNSFRPSRPTHHRAPSSALYHFRPPKPLSPFPPAKHLPSSPDAETPCSCTRTPDLLLHTHTRPPAAHAHPTSCRTRTPDLLLHTHTRPPHQGLHAHTHTKK